MDVREANVKLTETVHNPEFVEIITVKILVWELVAVTLNVRPVIMELFALVLKDITVTHLLLVELGLMLTKRRSKQSSNAHNVFVFFI